jgi:hypothetical protein
MTGTMGGVTENDLARFLSEDCPECGTPGPQRHLSVVAGCATCAAGDPRPVYIPARNVLPVPAPFRSSLAAAYSRPGPFGECYQMDSGSWVHVRPGCRCKT